MRRSRRRIYPTFHISHGDFLYAVDCRVELAKASPHVGGSPRHMSPGSPLRVGVLRILRDRIDVTEELFPMTRWAIDRAVYREAAARFGHGSVQGPDVSSTSFGPAPSFLHNERAAAIGRRILTRERVARYEREPLLPLGAL
jgi:hypothetical protein